MLRKLQHIRRQPERQHAQAPNAYVPCCAQALYILQRSWEAGGQLFDDFFMQVIICLALMVLFTGAKP